MNKKHKLEWLSSELVRYCGPIIVAPSIDSLPAAMTAGTYSLIDTGEKRLLVTCCHVWDEYDAMYDRNSKVVLAVNLGDGDCTIAFKNPLAHRLAFDRDLDLVVLEFDPKAIPVRHQKHWFKIPEWPIPQVAKGDCIATLGFPRARRKVTGIHVTFGCAALPFCATDTNNRSAAVFYDEENKQVLDTVRDCLAGMSGSPAYQVTENGELRLVGFTKTGSLESDAPTRRCPALAGSPLSAHMSLTHASFLQRNGALGSQLPMLGPKPK